MSESLEHSTQTMEHPAKKSLLLPDVDISCPDTYESHGTISTYGSHLPSDFPGGLVGGDQLVTKAPDTNNAIDLGHVDLSQAKKRFVTNVDKESHLDESIRQRIWKAQEKRYITTTRSETDSILDRYTRLLAEAQSLKEEFESQNNKKDGGNVSTEQDTDTGEDSLDMQSMIGSLKSLESQLVLKQSRLQPSGSTLASRLAQVKSDASSIINGSPSLGSTTDAQPLQIQPEAMTELTTRLNKLEKWLGMNDLGTDTFRMLSSALESSPSNAEGISTGHLIHSLSSLSSHTALLNGVSPGTGSLLDVLSRLEHHVSLLTDPKTFESLARRTRSLLPEMERLAELTRRQKLDMTLSNTMNGESNAPTNPETKLKENIVTTDQKILTLYRLLQSVEPLVHTLPSLHDRLSCLQTLHLEAANCVRSVSTATQDVSNMKQLLQGLDSSVQSVKKSIESNQTLMLENVQKLDKRLEKLLSS